ncbi:MAG: phospholipase D-like domain-containing protein [Meiothermus sp.]|nr:phospholipase D-like domain-containing protein [Meiothermus sp.]
MPRIFDNIEAFLLPALKQTLASAYRADFAVGYFNLRGWHTLADSIEGWSGKPDNQVRLLVGMQQPAKDALQTLYGVNGEENISNAVAARRRKEIARDFQQQLVMGTPTTQDEEGLRKLARQLRSKKLVVKLFLRHTLHAKLYLAYRDNFDVPIVGYIGSSNLTFAGLKGQGELNIDVLDADTAKKLSKWFEDRWNDPFCLDVSEELAQIIEESWAREQPLTPYQIYLKMAYHLSTEARVGLSQPRKFEGFEGELFDFQAAAVKIAAHHIEKRGGVVIGDVVGLGKTIIASALMRTLEPDYFASLIICPKNLVKMWQKYRRRFGLRAEILSMSEVIRELPKMPRFPLLVIDESHNLRNREGKTFGVIQEYIEKNLAKVVLLTATPYNKTYLDLSAQLRLFVPPDTDLGIRPEAYLRTLPDGEFTFTQKHGVPVRSIQAFEASQKPDDWRELMRLYMVRRTRSFIQANYAKTDESGRKYLEFSTGQRSYFPQRLPKALTFALDETNPQDQYARLYAERVVGAIEALKLPRYGLGNYLVENPGNLTEAEQKQVENLSRAGTRLKGFVKTNLFKRLESSGQVFLQSVERHILRNYVYLHALKQGLDLPIGTLDADYLEPDYTDRDEDGVFEDEATNGNWAARAAQVYEEIKLKSGFKWIRSSLFKKTLARDLQEDIAALNGILDYSGAWDPGQDTKLEALVRLLTQTHPRDKVLIFTQFADTVRYLAQQLRARGLQSLAGVTGDSDDPTALAARFSPRSNAEKGGSEVAPEDELRVLIATDVLSEGQNLQDAFVVVNYALPWAIIRLIQRVGGVDRTGQQAPEIFAYTFLPADGLERVIQLRRRLLTRLRENAEVVGTDEVFFEGEDERALEGLYHERAGILDEEEDGEVDLASYAYEIYKKAIEADPSLGRIIPALPNVVYSSKAHAGKRGVLVYLRTPGGADSLTWLDPNGRTISESQLEILRAAACEPETPPVERLPNHHELVREVARRVLEEERTSGGNLGARSSVKFRLFYRLRDYLNTHKTPMFPLAELEAVLEDLLRFPLKERAREKLGQQLRQNIPEAELVRLVVGMREEGSLCEVDVEEEGRKEPELICSMGLV